MFKKLYKAVLSDTTTEGVLDPCLTAPLLPGPRQLERLIPRCYLVQSGTAPAEKTEVFSEGTLFYIFYNRCVESIQKDAYLQLLKMGWLYSKKLGVFFQYTKKNPAHNELCPIVVFDHTAWKKNSIDVVLDEDFLKSVAKS